VNIHFKTSERQKGLLQNLFLQQAFCNEKFFRPELFGGNQNGIDLVVIECLPANPYPLILYLMHSLDAVNSTTPEYPRAFLHRIFWL
jgi:hypothetical protein